jgi:hypothetical protein
MVIRICILHSFLLLVGPLDQSPGHRAPGATSRLSIPVLILKVNRRHSLVERVLECLSRHASVK